MVLCEMDSCILYHGIEAEARHFAQAVAEDGSDMPF